MNNNSIIFINITISYLEFYIILIKNNINLKHLFFYLIYFSINYRK